MRCAPLVSLVLVALPSPVAGSEAVATVSRSDLAVVATAPARSPGPRVLGRSAAPWVGRLEGAWTVARERVASLPGCSELFASLGRDGAEVLASAIYVPTEARLERTVCARGAVAFTEVGSPVQRLCRGFRSLPTERAALVLLHEALHSAGLPESPSTPGAMSPSRIDEMVGAPCGLG